MTANPNPNPNPRPSRWRAATRRLSPRTVRTRVTLAAGLALTVLVTIGLAVLYLLQLRSADHTVQSQLRTYATQIEQSAAEGTFPRPLPNFALWPSDQAQVLASDGAVLAATQYLEGRPAIYRLSPGSATPVRQAAADGVVPGDVLVFGEHVTVGRRPVTIITGTASSYSLLHRVSDTFTELMVFGVPGLLILACGTVWLVVGRALRPVEQIRGAVSAISHADLSQRVPDPGTDDEIGSLARTMNDMLARLDDSAARQRRFVADASHELRSPLTAIRTSLEVGLSHPHRAPWPDIARRAARQAQRLEQLISQLLVLAKSDAGQLGSRRQPVSLAPLLADIRASIAAPGVSIDIAIAPGTTTTGNPEELFRMFRNIVDNAARYARHRVLITAVREAADIAIDISDDGPGIPAAERERVFSRFVRLDPSRGRANGSAGLGLAIARDIATAHGATITLAEAEGGGTRAVITLAETAGPHSVLISSAWVEAESERQLTDPPATWQEHWFDHRQSSDAPPGDEVGGEVRL
jgi:signal transduction histidine kinase